MHEAAFSAGSEEAGYVEGLRAEGAVAVVEDLSLVAVDGDAVVGHVCISRAHLDSGAPILVLAPMGVVPEHQRRRVGAALVREALRRAETTPFPLVSVLGHSTYYPRFGFERAADYGIVAPFKVPLEAWMMSRLPAYSPAAWGTVVYPKTFGEPVSGARL